MYLPRAFVEHIHLAEEDERDRPSDIADIQRLIVTIQDKDFLVHGAQASPNKKTHVRHKVSVGYALKYCTASVGNVDARTCRLPKYAASALWSRR